MKLKLGRCLLILSMLTTASAKPSILGIDLYATLSEHAVAICNALGSVARFGRYNIPQIEQVFFELRTPCKRVQYRVSEANLLRYSPDFDVKQKTVIFVSGWNSEIDAPYTQELTKAYRCRGGYNFIVVNTSTFIKGFYIKAAFNTEELGTFIAFGLKQLNIPGSSIHLIGHSLGAHIMGSVGRHFREETGDEIGRITGLDPARPCFTNAPSPAFSRLGAKDAKFVDIIHSNAKEAGTEEAIGHADFYPGGLMSTQPSCKPTDIQCSHAMSIRYFTESVYSGNQDNFIGYQCGYGRSLNVDTCSGAGATMGFAANANSKGVYVLGVREASPYGRNAKRDLGRKLETCGVCNE